VAEIKQDVKDLAHVATVHQLEIDKIEDKIGDE